jgi:ATP-dependent Clp protease adaptor protein ClpS
MPDAPTITKPVPTVKPQPQPGTKSKPAQLPPYHVVLLDDNQHTYDYVIDMLQALFAHDQHRALQMAKQVDQTGRAIVCTTHKERAELKCDQILGYGCDFRIASSKNSMHAVIQPAED